MRHQAAQPTSSIQPAADLLLVTVNSQEFSAVRSLLRPLPETGTISRVVSNRQTYHLGLFGQFRAAVIKTEMRSAGREAASVATAEAIHEVNPRAVVAIGVAFGAHPKQQTIGQVLVASHLITYDFGKEGHKRHWRGLKSEGGSRLRDRFAHAMQDWKHKKGIKRPILGPLLSGGAIIDDPELKAELLESFPDAIGGVMEAAAIRAAADRAGLEWIVVSAISDWADGSKSVGITSQTLAASEAARLALHVFSDPQALVELRHRDTGLASRPAPNAEKADAGADAAKEASEIGSPSRSSEANPKDVTAIATATCDVTITLSGDLNEFTAQRKAALLRALSAVLDANDPIVIKRVERGSIIVTLELTLDQAERLIQALRRGDIGDIDADDVKVAEPKPPPLSSTGARLRNLARIPKQGARLNHLPRKPRPRGASQAPLRRGGSLLITDIIGSTTMTTRLTVPVYLRLLTRHNAIIEAICEQEESALLVRHRGDEFNVLFDTPEAAVRAGLSIQHAMIAEPWSPEPMRLRMAIFTGTFDVVAIPGGTADLMGHERNMASRIHTLGGANRLLMNRATFEGAQAQLGASLVAIQTPAGKRVSVSVVWLNHGVRKLKGDQDPKSEKQRTAEVCEVGIKGRVPVNPP